MSASPQWCSAAMETQRCAECLRLFGESLLLCVSSLNAAYGTKQDTECRFKHIDETGQNVDAYSVLEALPGIMKTPIPFPFK
uniref:Uncharacterized protein n=1 Tax=Caenorhabditis japonica TaxID=281687 RepID=A0A8R1IJU8_CAEJA